MNLKQSSALDIFYSALAVLLAIVVWLVIYVLAYLALGLLGNNWLQNIFRELITPAVGGYAALYAVHIWLTRAYLKLVLWVFCVLIFLFMTGFPIAMIFFLPEGWTFSWGEQIIRWLGGATTVLGALSAHEHIHDRNLFK
jgi:hypothetical protein